MPLSPSLAYTVWLFVMFPLLACEKKWTFPTSGGLVRSGIWQIAFGALGLGQRLAWSLTRVGFDELKYA